MPISVDRYRDLRANRLDAVKEARETNDSSTFEGTKMLRSLPSDVIRKVLAWCSAVVALTNSTLVSDIFG